MFTILGADGKEYGPVTAGKVREWIAGGRANLQTRARRDSETEWKTLGDFAEFGAPSAPPPLAAQPPAIAANEPTTAAAAPLTGDARTIAADLIARAAPLDVFDCLGRSWNLWTANFLPLVGTTFVVIVIVALMGVIPLIGMVANLLLPGVIYGGLYYYYLGKIRGEPRVFGDAFSGFSRAFVPLMLTTLLTTALLLGIMLPFFGSWLFVFIKSAIQSPNNVPPLPGGGMLLGFLAVLLVVFYLSVSWVFALVLVIDKGLGPWTALEVSRRVVTRQWFRVFFVLLLGGFLTMLGLIGLFIGVFLTLPLMFGAILYAYEGLCNPPVNPAGAPTAVPVVPEVPPAS